MRVFTIKNLIPISINFIECRVQHSDCYHLIQNLNLIMQIGLNLNLKIKASEEAFIYWINYLDPLIPACNNNAPKPPIFCSCGFSVFGLLFCGRLKSPSLRGGR